MGINKSNANNNKTIHILKQRYCLQNIVITILLKTHHGQKESG
jgi:hypothetical protein